MKKDIRSKIIKRRSSQTKSSSVSKSSKIFSKLLSLEVLKPNMNVLVYMDFRNEVITSEINEYILNNNIRLLLPKVNFETKLLEIYVIDLLSSLEKSSYNILEPTSSHKQIEYEDIDLILAPGVAFDDKCFRLGYGGGYYDKLLSNKRDDVKVIALAYELQIIDSVPIEEHDYQMDYIITEERVIKKDNELI